jgi:hypothetical protein
MTAQKYISYEIVLMQQQFRPTGRIITQPPNWTRKTFSDQTIARVFVSNDGHFKAYNRAELILCHGDSPDQLEYCFD